jgi:glutamate synthase (NADPH) small chain
LPLCIHIPFIQRFNNQIMATIIPRSIPAKRPVQERLQDYGEYTGNYTQSELQTQSARCMNCGIPFCHQGCPLGNVIPEFNEAVHQQQWKRAYDILTATNPFPEFTGRICPAPCESACVLGLHESPVSIEEIEKHIIEIAFDQGYVKAKKSFIRSGKKIAIVGSGPAGLAAAWQLNQLGHQVTVFERDAEPGGLLRYGIPDFKLEKWVIDRRIELMREEGIQFKCHTHVGINITIDSLLREFHALVLCGGSTVPRDLSIPDRSAKGVHFAMSYLKQQNKQVAGRDPFEQPVLESNYFPSRIHAAGKDVIVIGGGDTGSDCVGTANRQGAKSVTQLELMPMPPTSRNQYMPWPNYPILFKQTPSHEEGCARFFAVATKSFQTDENGHLTGLTLVDLEWKRNEKDQPISFHEIAGSERTIPCQLALLAMGFLHPETNTFVKDLSLPIDEKGTVQTLPASFQTEIPKVFVAGDMRRGQSLVVWAIQEGRDCAFTVDQYLLEPK